MDVCVLFLTIQSVTMSWLTRILPKIASKPADAENKKKSPIPAGLWTKCPKCDQVLYKEELDDSLQVCPKCGHHLRLSGRKRLDAFLDWKGVHEEIGADVRPVDTLWIPTLMRRAGKHLRASRRKPTRWLSCEASCVVVLLWRPLLTSPSWAAPWAVLSVSVSLWVWNELCVKTFRL